MPDPIIRAIRTFIQSALGVIALQSVALISDANDGVLDASLWQRAGVTAAVSGFVALVSYIQNVIEEASGKSLLK